MRVLIAPDGFGGTLTATEAAAAIAAGWRRARPDDVLVERPLADGGEGLLDVVAGPDDTWVTREVAGPLGHPVEAAFLLRADGSAVVESARACGLALVARHRRTPLLTTTYGVGQLLDAAREAGARRILLGLGGSATVDGGAGALTGLGFRVSVADGSGLKIGGDDLHRVAHASRGWAASFDDVEVELLADVTTVLGDAAARFGPQKGAGPQDVTRLADALQRWADVLERDLGAPPTLRHAAGSGAAGGLGYGLAAALGARFVPGAATVAALVDLAGALDDVEVVVTGEGRLDATTTEGKVVAHVAATARTRGVRPAAVVGQLGGTRASGHLDLEHVEVAAPDGPGEDPAAEVALAAARLAAHMTDPASDRDGRP